MDVIEVGAPLALADPGHFYTTWMVSSLNGHHVVEHLACIGFCREKLPPSETTWSQEVLVAIH